MLFITLITQLQTVLPIRDIKWRNGTLGPVQALAIEAVSELNGDTGPGC